MRAVAVGIFCKTPAPGLSKTRLSPPLRPDECSALSACFIRDLAATIHTLSRDGDVAPYAIYTPAGTEPALRALLPPCFNLQLQCTGDFGMRLQRANADLLRFSVGLENIEDLIGDIEQSLSRTISTQDFGRVSNRERVAAREVKRLATGRAAVASGRGPGS